MCIIIVEILKNIDYCMPIKLKRECTENVEETRCTEN